MSSLNYVVGDVTQPQEMGYKLIPQINNDLGVIGAGLSGALMKKWPITATEYKKWYKSKIDFQGGNIQVVEVEKDISVVNMIAQHGIKGKNHPDDPPIRYHQLEECLNKVAQVAQENNACICSARIGAGLVLGSWSVIEDLFIKCLVEREIKVTIYDLPARK